MKPRLACTLATLALTAAAALSLMNFLPSARGCGLDWALPRNHFEGVTNQGHVSYWEKIGEVDCGDGLVLPLHINFSSRRDGGTPSPYLGQGWMLALLESKFVQESEDRFNMIQPDGLNNLFLRAEKGGSVLNGSSGWKGEIQGDTINAWASCGWKLVFANGRIASMTTAKGRKLDWVYEGGKASELREGNATRLKVEYSADGKVQALALPGGGERILVGQDKKPRVQSVAGQNIIAGVDNSLSHLVLADGRTQDFTFGTDENGMPTLEVGGEGNGAEGAAATKRQVVWDPQSKLAVRDGEWTYQITPAKEAGSNAAIGRTSAQKQKEYWFRDDAKGEETVLEPSGVKIITSWFTAGKLAGAMRKRQRISGGETKTIYQASYDEQGRLFREVFEDGSTNRITYSNVSEKPDKDRTVKDSGLLRAPDQNIYNVSTVQTTNGKTIQYNYDDKGREIRMFIDGKLHSRKTYASDNSWNEEIVFDDDATHPSRTLRQEFNIEGKLIKNKIIDLTGRFPDVVKEYSYDSLGRLTKQISSQAGTTFYTNDIR